jgi:hypothetical protein
MTLTLVGSQQRLSQSEREGWAYHARTLERFDVTAAYDWHQAGLDASGQSLAAFPPLRMPYSHLWVEAGSHLVSGTRLGAFVKDVSNEDESELLSEIRAEKPDSIFGERMLLLAPIEWSEGKGQLFLSPLFHVIHITEDGRFVDYDVSTGSVTTASGVTVDMVKYTADVQQTFLVKPLLFGMSLSNVKGARISTPRLIGNPHTKKGKRKSPRNRYRIIAIPGSPTDDRPGRGGHRDVAKHLVRGHFKTWKNYFGKGPATWWVPFHSRGKREQGVVEKDYSVEPPTD